MDFVQWTEFLSNQLFSGVCSQVAERRTLLAIDQTFVLSCLAAGKVQCRISMQVMQISGRLVRRHSE